MDELLQVFETTSKRMLCHSFMLQNMKDAAKEPNIILQCTPALKIQLNLQQLLKMVKKSICHVQDPPTDPVPIFLSHNRKVKIETSIEK